MCTQSRRNFSLRRSARLHTSALSRFAATRGAEAGLTLLEILISVGILASAFGGVYAVFGRGVNLVRQANYDSVADRNTLTRLDQLRSKGWSKLVDPTSVSSLLATPIPATGTLLPVTEETVTVTPRVIPPTAQSPASSTTSVAAPTPYYVVKRTGTGAPVVTSSGVDLATLQAQKQLTITVGIKWEFSGRTQTRELAAVLAKTASR